MNSTSTKTMTLCYAKPGLYAFAVLMMVSITMITRADDIELYTTAISASTKIKPNVLLIIDSSGSMDAVDVPVETTICTADSAQSCESATRLEERLQVVKNVANNLITQVSGINLGIMSFVDGASEGGYVRKELVDIDAIDAATGIANKTLLKEVVNGIDHAGATPLGETLYEAVRYFKGELPDFGSFSSVTAARNGVNYKSPITNSCQTVNNIIMLSDGQPNSDFNHNEAIQAYLNSNDGIGAYLGPIYDCPHESSSTEDALPTNSCLVDIASHVANNDLSSLPGEQSAALYTIGFTKDLAIMKQAATAGKGNYYQSNSVAELTASLNNIMLRIMASDTVFMPPAISVNAFNRLQHNNEIYYAMFRPASDARWDGNIKKYRVTDAGQILDQNNNVAINSASGFFKNTAQSYWSSSVDGKSTISGGARSKQDAPRRIFTYTGTNVPYGGTSLNQSEHRMQHNNSLLTPQAFGVSTSLARTRLINWALGYQRDGTTPHRFIGDPLHSQPSVVVYGGSSENNMDTTVFFGTNEGFLHAIDGESGVEEFAFIPKVLLPNLKDYADDTAATKRYGMDGEITIWKNDLNQNGVIYDASGQLESGEGVYLYVGMRRGGNKYYALDVTDRDAPKLMWRINGGLGEFSELGQTWSKPLFGKVKLNGTTRSVLFFGGGYDENQDRAIQSQTDDIGRALFMVDARSGKLLWSAGPNDTDNLILTDMQYSIPANVTIADISNDGLIDVVFAATMGGEVWRFDIDNTGNTSADNFASGGKVLEVRGATEQHNRKFFGSPDVSLFAPRGSAAYFLIAIGSGTRSQPLNEAVKNRFYLKKEYSPFDAPTNTAGEITYTVHTESDLYDATDNLLQTGTVAQQASAQALLASASGWRIDLLGKDRYGGTRKGEKVISASVTFGGRVIFTTYTPDLTSSGIACSLNLGVARLYIMDVLDGTAVADLDNDGDIESDDLNKDLQQTGLPASASIIFTQKTDEFGADVEGQTRGVLCVATECYDDVLGDVGGLAKVYWREDS